MKEDLTAEEQNKLNEGSSFMAEVEQKSVSS